MFHVKLIKGEKGMLQLKGGESILIHTVEKILKARGALVERRGKRMHLPGACGLLSKQRFLQDSFLSHQTLPQKFK